MSEDDGYLAGVTEYEELKHERDQLRLECNQLATRLAELAQERNTLARQRVDAVDDLATVSAEYRQHRQQCSREYLAQAYKLASRGQHIKNLRVELRLLRKELKHAC